MWQRRSSPTSASRAQRGYTLLEILVAVALGSTVAYTAISGYAFITRSWLSDGQRLETQQNLRTALDLLTRDLRVAGACLPDVGPSDIKALAGADAETSDSITVRANIRCAIATMTAPVVAGETVIAVDNVTNFIAGTQAYILHQDTTIGEYVTIASVDTGALTLTLETGTTQEFPAASSVYGAESQTYTIDTSGTVPVMTVARSFGLAQPVVFGIEYLNIEYVLNRNCIPGPCDVVTLPADDTEWALVRTIRLDVRARSSRTVPSGNIDVYFRLGQLIEVKPRNFLF